MAELKKTVIAEIQAAKNGLLNILSGGQNADGQEIDAHITTAAEVLDEALNRLEQERDADSAKAGEAGHQMRVRMLIELFEGDVLIGMKPDEIEVLFKPVSFDPAIPVMLNRKFGWKPDNKKALDQIGEIFGNVSVRSNAISVLKTQTQQVRGLCSAMENAEYTNGNAAAAAFDDVLNALENWNDDLTCYGG